MEHSMVLLNEELIALRQPLEFPIYRFGLRSFRQEEECLNSAVLH